jgi:hypothetical protein
VVPGSRPSDRAAGARSGHPGPNRGLCDPGPIGGVPVGLSIPRTSGGTNCPESLAGDTREASRGALHRERPARSPSGERAR